MHRSLFMIEIQSTFSQPCKRLNQNRYVIIRNLFGFVCHRTISFHLTLPFFEFRTCAGHCIIELPKMYSFDHTQHTHAYHTACKCTRVSIICVSNLSAYDNYRVHHNLNESNRVRDCDTNSSINCHKYLCEPIQLYVRMQNRFSICI